jgi:hypothetical protein
MIIDIVDYTEEQFASLSTEKLIEIRSAQKKKDELAKNLQEDIARERRNLIDKGAYPSNVFEKVKAELTAKFDAEVQVIREALLFFLHYVADARNENIVVPDVPYIVDYSKTAEERMFSVKEYYETTYEDPVERYMYFKKDTFARSYLGELYAPLHDYFYIA